MDLYEIRFTYDSVISPAAEEVIRSSDIRGDGTRELKLDEDRKVSWHGQTHFIVDAVALRLLISETAKVEVLRVISNEATKRLGEFGQRHTTVVNERCSVAVAGLGLLTVDEVECHEDLCTEKLQDFLEKGWRILAVCVQPDQRRPDYILGRTSK